MAKSTSIPDPVNSQAAAQRFRKASKAYAKEATQSQEKARQVLIELGIYTPKGKLTKRYSR